MATELLLLGGAAAAAVVVTTADTHVPPPSKKGPHGSTPLPIPTPGSSTQPAHKVLLLVGHMNLPHVAGSASITPTLYPGGTTTTAVGSGTNSDDPQIAGKLAEIDAGAKVAYDQLSADAKQKGAQAINAQLGTDLTGNEDYEKVASVVGGAVGGAVGGYFGGPIGAKLGAIVGAYLGVKLEDLIAKNWNEIKDWISSNWDNISDTVSGYASDAADAVGDYASDAGSAVSDTASDAYDYVGGYF